MSTWAARHFKTLLAVAVVVGLGIHFAYPALAGLHRSLDVLRSADPWWLAAAALCSVACQGCYVAVFRAVVDGTRTAGARRLGWSGAYQMTMASQAASTVITAGGAGGIALLLWALARAGYTSSQAVARVVAMLVFHYSIYLFALFTVGLGLWFGVLPGRAPVGLTLVPAIIAAAAFAVGCAALRRPAWLKRATGRGPKPLRIAASVADDVADGVRLTWALVRHPSGARTMAFASLYWATNIAILACCFEAFGARPELAGLVQAFFVGQTANLLPLLPGGVGSVEAGMIGALLAFGEPGAEVVVSVLAYRLLAFWLPTIPQAAAYFQLRGTIARWQASPARPEPSTTSDAAG